MMLHTRRSSGLDTHLYHRHAMRVQKKGVAVVKTNEQPAPRHKDWGPWGAYSYPSRLERNDPGKGDLYFFSLKANSFFFSCNYP